METKILVTSITSHRIDVQLANWFCRALAELQIPYTTSIYSSYDIAIVFNGVLDITAEDKLSVIKNRARRVLYMYDDCDLTIPTGITLVTQFTTDPKQIHFPIAQLAIFDDKWDNPIVQPKSFDIFYGGTYKDRRDYSIIPNSPSTLLVGDDTRWDKWDKATRLGTIRDMNLMYQLMAMCSTTLIVSDPRHNWVNTPLRFYEGVFTQCNILDAYGNTFAPQEVKQMIKKEDILCNIKQLIQMKF